MSHVTKKVKRRYMSKRILVGASGHDPKQLSSSEIVRFSRNILEKSQAEFGQEISKTQSVVSKYERGEVEPPSGVISHCMTILVKHRGIEEISLDDVINRLKQSAAMPIAPFLFRAVVSVIDAVSAGERRLE